MGYRNIGRYCRYDAPIRKQGRRDAQTGNKLDRDTQIRKQEGLEKKAASLRTVPYMEQNRGLRAACSYAFECWTDMTYNHCTNNKIKPLIRAL